MTAIQFRQLDPSCPNDRESWDQFLLNCQRGQHVQLTTWLESYAVYGAQFTIIVAESESRIVGGIGLIELGNRFCRLGHCPAGPVVEIGHEAALGPLLQQAVDWCRERGWITLQIQAPATADELPHHFLLSEQQWREAVPEDLRTGPALSGLAGIEQMLWVAFPAADDEEGWREALFQRFSSSTRRNIRIAERAGVEVCEAKSESELKDGYSIIEENGVAQGYPTRTWNEFRNTLISQTQRGHASLFVASHESRKLGAIYGAWTGKRFTDCMAGTIRTKPDLKIGHFIRYQAMLAAWRRGMMGYDLTADGPPGVREAKYGFRPQKLVCIAPYHRDFAPIRAGALRLLGDSLRKHRRTLANLSSRWSRRSH